MSKESDFFVKQSEHTTDGGDWRKRNEVKGTKTESVERKPKEAKGTRFLPNTNNPDGAKSKRYTEVSRDEGVR